MLKRFSKVALNSDFVLWVQNYFAQLMEVDKMYLPV
jgi:hypothetical protein